MPFDPVREAAYGERERATTATTSTGRSTSPTSPLFTPVGVPPSPSVKKFSLANILNDDPALDPSLRSPEARISSSSSYLDYSSSPVFEFPPRSASSSRSLSHQFFPSPSMAPTLTQTASPGVDTPSRPSSSGRSLPPPTFALASPPPPRPPPTLYSPQTLLPNAPALLPISQTDIDTLTRSRNWLRKGVDRASLPPPRAIPLPPPASSLPPPPPPPAAAPPTGFSDEHGIGYYLPPRTHQAAEQIASAAGRYSPSGPTRGAYSPSRPTSGKRQREEDALRTPPPKRRAPSGPDDLSAVVAGHYNARPEVGRTARRESPIIALKNFNNWVKSVLIQKYGRVGRGGRDALVRVLDIGCGKGGDLLKWSKNGVGEYIGLDVAEISVRQAEERYLDMRQWRMRAYFQALDCYRESIRDALPKEVFASPFQTVSMQFCMHYAFYSEHAVRTMLDNVATNLEQGGTFIGTIPNAEHILASLPPGELTFGNPVFRITFPHPPPAPPAPEEQDQSAAFGHKYNFFLQDAVGEDEAGVPEYLVHWPNFVRLAAEYGLVQEYRKDFADLLNEEREHEVYGPLLRRMKVIDAAGESDMDEEQWEAASIYLAFAFRKR